MRRRITWAATAATGALLLLPAAAGAGGMATVGLSSLPDGTPAGRPWDVRLAILQHGRTPLSGVQPKVRVTSADGGSTRTFAARPTSRAGVYRARVVFPEPGRWTYVVDDGFTQTHTFAAVRIGSGSAEPAATASSRRPAPLTAAANDGPDLMAAALAALGAGLLAALAAGLVVRRRTPAGPAAAARP